MNILSVTWTSDKTTLIVVTDSETKFVPNDMINPDRKLVKNWTDIPGNSITDPSGTIIIPESISDRQFFQQLAVQGIITDSEALAAVSTGTIPKNMLDLVNQLPASQQFSAKMIMSGASQFQRHHPMTMLLGQLEGWSDAQIDQLFIDANKL